MKRFVILLFLLITTGLWAQSEDQHLMEGKKAPLIKAKDQNGKLVDSKEILKDEKLIVVFYRGQWCPYCNRHLAALEENVDKFTAAGARLIAITPEKPKMVSKTIEKTHASYSILWDRNNKIMKSFGVDFVLPPNLQKKYKKFGVDLSIENGNDTQVLPVPATYVIGKDGTIKYVHYNTDYKKRSTAKEILKHL
jgi:peroxiredoxin